MLEPMDLFFDRRLKEYDAHQLHEIESAREFYSFTAAQLPRTPGAQVLDLGCGTGLELEYYFARTPTARVTGIDLAAGMLQALREKFPGRDLKLIQGSYLELPLGEGIYDAAVSVESLHHFTRAEKVPLYRRVLAALKPGGYFLLTDYFAASDLEEEHFRAELLRLRAAENVPDGTLCHFDTPLTLAHEQAALREAGFTQVELLGTWGATATLRAAL